MAAFDCFYVLHFRIYTKWAVYLQITLYADELWKNGQCRLYLDQQEEQISINCRSNVQVALFDLQSGIII